MPLFMVLNPLHLRYSATDHFYLYAHVSALCSGGDDALLDEASLAARADAAAKASADAAGPSTGVKSAAAGKTNARMGTGRRAGRLDLSGVWKRVKVENYENFLGAQGATFVQRKLASSLPLVHTFSFSKDLMAFNLVEKGTSMCVFLFVLSALRHVGRLLCSALLCDTTECQMIFGPSTACPAF
jgi:hypothetical protein